MPSDTSADYSNDDALDWMQKIQAQERRCDEENAVRRGLWKSCKAAGHNLPAMRRAIRNSKTDHDTVVATYRDEIRYSGLRHIPLNPETLFDGMDFAVTEKTQHGSDVWDAEEGGYQAGRHGAKAEDCPYDAGTELHVHWLTWREKGERAVAAAMGPDATIAPTSRKRPRRRQPPLPMERPTGLPRRRSRRHQGAEIAADGAAVY